MQRPREKAAERENHGFESAEEAWEIEDLAGVWRPFMRSEDLIATPGQKMEFYQGPHLCHLVFDTSRSGVQVNYGTGEQRRLRLRRLGGMQAEHRQEPSPPRSFASRYAEQPPSPQRHSDLFGPDRLPSPQSRRQFVDQPPAGLDDTRPREGKTYGDAPPAHDVASEAYRELQKIGQSSAKAEHPQTPEVIVLGDGQMTEGVASDLGPAADPEPAAFVEPNTFAILEDLENQMQEISRKLCVVLEALEEEAVTMGKARDNFAQLESRLQKLQCQGIDCVSLDGLSPRKSEEVRAIRRELTRKAEHLQSELDKIFAERLSESFQGCRSEPAR
jgi:hypothetical protein